MDGGLAMFRALGWDSRDAVAFIAATFATLAILINVLFMQSGSHPAPMFRNAPLPVKPVATESVPAVPRPRPVEAASLPAPQPAPGKNAAPAPAPPRGPRQTTTAIHPELGLPGYY